VRLVDWLGDVPAGEATEALERDLSNALLGDVGERARHREQAERVERSWSRIGDWFTPAFDARILALLVPAHDAERERIGFYRFVLPRPRVDDAQPSPLPPSPLALRTVRWLLSDPATAVLVAGRLQVVDAAYGTAGRRELRRAGCTIDEGVAQEPARVELSLAGEAEEERAAPLRLTAYFRGGSDPPGAAETGPSCVEVRADPDGPAGLRMLERKLNRAIGLAQPPASTGASGASPVSSAGAADPGAGTSSIRVSSP
jgi:hypothetical protein